MKILGIETSCDDTGIAILDVFENGEFKVLANIISSQTEIGKKYGGVFPAMAKREHQKNLAPTLITALKGIGLLKIEKTGNKIVGNFTQAKNLTIKNILEREPELEKQLIPFLQKYAKPDIDVIAITSGPGLEPCLWVGVNFAKALACVWDIPIVEVNHIKAHVFVNALNNGKTIEDLSKKNFPALCLVVSGGHTQLFLMKDFGKYQIIGETRDDAAGECFDKCAKILGLGYPGGQEIARLAEQTLKAKSYKLKAILPRPMIGTKDYDFSFSGLKTAVLYADRKVTEKTAQYKKEMAVEVQQAIIDVLIKKTIKAAKDFKVKTLMLGGGVTANKELRKQLKEKFEKEMPGTKFSVPVPSLSTDNGLMVAITGYFRRTKKIAWQELSAQANLRVSK